MGLFIPEYEGQAEDIRKEVLERCELYNKSSKKPYYLGISVGCATFYDADAATLSDEMKHADKELYKAKKLRRKNVVRA